MLPQRDPSFYIYPQPPPSALRFGSLSSPTAPRWFPLPLPPLSLSALLPLSSLSSPCSPSPGEVWVLPVLPRSQPLALQWNSAHQAVPLKPTARFKSEHQLSAEINPECHCPVVRRRGQPLWETDDSISRKAAEKGAAKKSSRSPQVTCGILRTVWHPKQLVLNQGIKAKELLSSKLSLNTIRNWKFREGHLLPGRHGYLEKSNLGFTIAGGTQIPTPEKEHAYLGLSVNVTLEVPRKGHPLGAVRTYMVDRSTWSFGKAISNYLSPKKTRKDDRHQR